MKSKGGATGMVGDMTGDMTQYIKGMKTRTDQTSGKGRLTSTIIDMAAKRMIVLDHDKKEAQITDMASPLGHARQGGRDRHHLLDHADRADADRSPGRRARSTT